MRDRRRHRLGAAAVMVAALMISLIPASPAAAAVADVEAVGGGELPGRIVRASCRVTGALISLNTLQLVVEADASATPDGLLTQVQCTATSAGGGSVTAPPIACPGPACASAGTGQVRLGLITVCVSATGHFGPLFPESKTVSHCATGAGAKLEQDWVSVN
ncbi:MAG TPA: hypothetical protein VHN37_08970 [Actinomycetota bacterium]|nr:hypothetical protein [Actinomycetota bacterium]